MTLFSHWRFFHSIIVMVGISLVKISIAFFLRRFVPSKNYQRFLVGAIIFLVAFTLSCAGTLIFNCGTMVAANWNFALRVTGGAKCFSNTTFTNIGLFNSSVNIATDVLFALLPVPVASIEILPALNSLVVSNAVSKILTVLPFMRMSPELKPGALMYVAVATSP